MLVALRLCPKNMKPTVFGVLGNLHRPVAIMTTLFPIAALVVTYGTVQWMQRITPNWQITNPELAMTIEGYATFFQDYAIPALMLAVALAVVNLLCAFASRARACGVQ
jgi:hypothetical protein